MKKLFLVTIFSILLTSCATNSIYFNLEKDSIISCDDSLISKVIITSMDDNFEYYRFTLQDGRNGIGVKTFNVKKISNAFKIEGDLGNKIERYEYYLKPSTKYKITHVSKCDAAEQSVIITLDETGDIIEADIISCN